MDIAFVNRAVGMARGGGEIWELQIANALASMGDDVTIYTGAPLTGNLLKSIEPPVRVVRSPFLYNISYAAPIGIGGLIGDIDRQLFISQIARHLRDDHDIVHVSGFPEFFRIRDTVNAPMVITLHGTPHSLFYDYIHPWRDSYSWLNVADGVVAGGATVSELEDAIERDVTRINPGVDVDLFTPNGPTVETSGPTILWVGRFVPAKDLTELIDAFTILQEEVPQANLWLVGEGGKKPEIASHAVNRGVEDSVRFCGYVGHSELPAYYRAADVFGFSSKHESFGMVLLEAMACGTPVVAPNIDYIPQIVADGETGLLYEKGDEEELANWLMKLLQDSKLRESLGGEAAIKVRNNNSWDTQSEKLRNLFVDLVE